MNLKKEKARGKDYTGAGGISTSTFKHGYYEARFRMPIGAGWHTSIWLTLNGEDRRHEIDICENNSKSPRRFHLNLHSWDRQGNHQRHGKKTIETDHLAEQFHVWGCEFTPESVRYYSVISRSRTGFQRGFRCSSRDGSSFRWCR